MKELRKKINDLSFEHEKEAKAVVAIETIFSLVASRDLRNLRKMNDTKLGSAMLDIAEVYGENTQGCISNFRKDK